MIRTTTEERLRLAREEQTGAGRGRRGGGYEIGLPSPDAHAAHGHLSAEGLGLFEVDRIRMSRRRVGLRHVQEVAVPVPIGRADDGETPVRERRVESGQEALVRGAVRTEAEGVLAAHEPQMTHELKNVLRAPADDRRAEPDEVVVLEAKRVGISYLLEVALRRSPE